MTRTRLWVLAVVPVTLVAVLASQFLVSAQADSVQLRGFQSCDELHEHYLELIDETTGPVPLPAEVDGDILEAEADSAIEDAMEEESAAVSPSSPAPAPAAGASGAAESTASQAAADEGVVSETGTNVQERGVDEPDIIKTDGEYVYVLRPQSLLIAEIDGDGPLTEVGRITFDEYGLRQELLIGDDVAVVVRQLEGRETIFDFGDDVPDWLPVLRHYREQSQVLAIDITNAARPRLDRALSLDGRYVSGRLVDDNMRIVMQDQGFVPWIPPWWFGRGATAEQMEAWNEELRELVGLGHWYPLYGLVDGRGRLVSSGLAVECTQAFAPEGVETQSQRVAAHTTYMLSFDLDEGIDEWGGVGVLGMASEPTVYSSVESLYLASPHNSWQDTAVHRFDLSDPLEPAYFGAGVVGGRLLSQWSLSEHDGHLRVATTDWSRWPTISRVSVLRPTPHDAGDRSGVNRPLGTLEQVGQVSGLGATESIFAVRFAGDIGYVVTFRQVDPLYTLDLSDPENPLQVGELKIPGFSRYLHPLSGGLLLGVGRDADPDTGRQLGLQASLFDVSDLAEPEQLSVLPLGDDAFSLVETNHRAFRYEDGVAWIPVGPESYRLREGHDGAFLGVAVSDEGLSHEATLRVHGEAQRALPIDGLIHLLSDEEIRTYQLDEYEDVGSLSFHEEWDNRWMPPSPE